MNIHTVNKVMVLVGLHVFILGIWLMLLPSKLAFGGLTALIGAAIFLIYLSKLK